ncbi:MAG: hypothetical protein FJ299_05775 [Planctomycetes bacterium]|nr:hypothetical protein [Planctomycetota bacterium]
MKVSRPAGRAPRPQGRLETSRGGRRDPLRRGAEWVAVLLIGLAGAACGRSSSEPVRSVLLVTFDTTRPDVFGCMGGPAGLTPAVDGLAAEGVVFDAARTVSPLTLPAHASMLTGLVPLRHGLRDNGIGALSPAARTLAELAREQGRATGAFVGSLVLDRAYGLEQGFEVYTAPNKPGELRDLHFPERHASLVAADALAWLAGPARERAFFCWMHFYDPHAPHMPKSIAPAPPQAGEPKGWSAYLAEVRECDAALGSVLDLLRQQGRLDQTTVLVTADHGESFGQHGELTHGMFAYDATLRVPFVLRRADRARAGTRDAGVVSVTDVYPTLAEALGIDAPAGDGISVYDGPAPTARYAYCETYFPWLAHGWSGLAGTWDTRAKYLHTSKSELYDLVLDPGEERNLLPADAERAAPYREALAAFASRGRLPVASAGVDHSASLQQLGYAGASGAPRAWPEPLEDSTRRAPIDGKSELKAMTRAIELAYGGRWLEVVVKLDEVLAANPANWTAVDKRAFALLQLNRHADALVAYEQLDLNGPAWPATKVNLATCLLALSRPADAQAALEARLADHPRDPVALELAARVARELGDEPRALDYERRRALLGATGSALRSTPADR